MVTVTPLDATLGATVTDVGLADMTEAVWQTVEAAFHEHALLIFPGQHLTDDEQVAFAERFGEIELLTPNPELKALALSNKAPDGPGTLKPDAHRFKALRGNEGWHTDSTYMPLAAKASVLSAIQVPSRGGETEWADMRAAWDALDEVTQQRLSGLKAYHSLYQSQLRAGFHIPTGAGYGYHTKGAPLRPVMKLHPVTGRPALYTGRHAFRIEGMEDEAALDMLDKLLADACQAPRTHRHQWSAGDVIIWDNRCVLHRACPYDAAEVRIMRHTRIAGDPATELAPTVADNLAEGYEKTSSNAF